MTIHRYTFSFSDAYVLAELHRRYDSAGPEGRIALLRGLYEQDEDHRPPYEIVALAADDSHAEVRCWLARNGRYLDYSERDADGSVTFPDRNLVDRLNQDQDPFVKACLRENPDILGFFGTSEVSKRWFHQSSHLERLALVRNVKVAEDLILLLFDASDTELAIDLHERFELCCAFLTNRALLDEKAKQAFASLGDLPTVWDFASSRDRSRFLSSLWTLAVKWPKDRRERYLQEAVYVGVPADDGTKAEVYQSSSRRSAPHPTSAHGCSGSLGILTPWHEGIMMRTCALP